MTSAAEKHLTKARGFLSRGEEFYRKAAEEIVAAKDADPTLSNREIGEWFGHSEHWVRKVVTWGTSSTRSSTPFWNEAEDQRLDRSATKKVLRESTPEEIEKKILSDPEIRANVGKAFDRHYSEKIKKSREHRHDRDVEEAGGEEELAENERQLRIGEVVNVVRGLHSKVRFVSYQVKELGLEPDDPRAEKMREMLEEVVDFASILIAVLGGKEVTDADIAALIEGSGE